MKIVVRLLMFILLAAAGVSGYFYRDRIAYSYTELKDRYAEIKNGPELSPTEQWRFYARKAYDMLLHGEVGEALKLAEKALKIADAEPPDAGLALLAPSLRLRGFCYTEADNYFLAKADFERAVSVVKGGAGATPGNSMHAEHLKNLADLYLSGGNAEPAEPLYIEALKLIDIKKESNFQKTAEICFSLGNVNFIKKDFELAEKFYQRGLDFMENAVGPEHRESIPFLTALGNSRMVQKDYEQAERSFTRALIINESERGPYDIQNIHSLQGLANVNLLQKKYTSAVSSVNRIIKILENNPDCDPEGLREQKDRLEKLMEIRRKKS